MNFSRRFLLYKVFSKTLQNRKDEVKEEETITYELLRGESKRMSSLCKQLLTLASLDKEEKVFYK